MNISVGHQFPNFSGRTFDGQYFDLASLSGKHVVIFFYPKDDAAGCALEAGEFSRILHQFHEIHADVIGVSVDSLDSHKRFCAKHNLKVPLISDSKKVLAEKLGIVRASGAAARTTFVLDGQGNIRKIFETVNPNGHAEAVLSYLKERIQEGRTTKKASGRERTRKTKINV